MIASEHFKGTQGFTLTELLMGLTIALIITGLAVYNLAASSPRQQLKGAAQSLRGSFQLARQKAISQGKKVEIVFSSKGYNHPVMGDETLPHGIEFGPLSTTLPGDAKKCSNGDDRFCFSGTDKNVATFYRDGRISSGHVTLNNHNEAIALVINVPGRIKQWGWNGHAWEETKTP